MSGALLTGCGGPGPVPVAVPSPGPSAVSSCTRLHNALPANLAGHERRETQPRSDLVAAWGDPAIVLRCGVPKPAGLSPDAGLVGIGYGDRLVSWFQHYGGSTVEWTAVDRPVYVELVVPKSYQAQGGVLVAVAKAIVATLPARKVAA